MKNIFLIVFLKSKSDKLLENKLNLHKYFKILEIF